MLGDKIWIVGGEKPELDLDLQAVKKTNLNMADFFNPEKNPIWKKHLEHMRSKYTYLNSTEYIRLNQETEKGPKLPFRISNHAMVKVDETTVYIMGGCDVGGWQTNETWIVDFSNGFKVKKGPELMAPRCDHSSAVMKIDGKTILVVVGGARAGMINEEVDVELLDLSEPNPCWKEGMETKI